MKNVKNKFKRVERFIIAIAIINFIFPAKVIIKTASQAMDNPFVTVILFMLIKYIATVLGYSLYDKGKIPVGKLIMGLGLALAFLLFELCLYKDVMLFLLANLAWLVLILSHLKGYLTYNFYSWFSPLHMNANNAAGPSTNSNDTNATNTSNNGNGDDVNTLPAVKHQIKVCAAKILSKFSGLQGANSRFKGAFERLQQTRARLQEEETQANIALARRYHDIVMEERNKVRDLEIELRTEMDRKEALVQQARGLGASSNYLAHSSSYNNNRIGILNTSRQIMGPEYDI